MMSDFSTHDSSKIQYAWEEIKSVRYEYLHNEPRQICRETYIYIQNPTSATEKWMPRRFHAKQLTNKNNLPASLPSQLGKNLLGQQQQCPLETYVPGKAADFCP